MADKAGYITAVHAEYLPETRSGAPRPELGQDRDRHLLLPVHAAVAAEVRLYDRLFTEAQPDASEKNFFELLNRDSKTVLRGVVEASLANAQPDDKFQVERNGHFVTDRKDHRPEAPVFNLAV